MTPMEAWHIISANMANYYRMRRGPGFEKGYVPADTEAEVICFKALREMEERMKEETEEVGLVDALREENARLSRLNTELETQMRQMVAQRCSCDGCDWREEDGTA